MDSLFYLSKITASSLYLSCIILLCIFGLNRFYLIYLNHKYRGSKTSPERKFTNLPKVTVQLPIFNELYVVKRLIDSVCKLDYPRDLIEIQVLDDSTDDTSRIAKLLTEQYRARGFNISYLHRENRSGFKAGALNFGLGKSTGDFIAIFDADFIPTNKFLQETIHHFTNEKVGIVQVRWGHINRDFSSLTKAQSILLDGHFTIEQNSRYFGNYFLNFNGTAGLLRKKSIIESGGWQHDTLTEDLDLSYRIQLDGWKIIYLDDVVVNAELPVDINSFKSQQHRWAKGGTQTALKLMPRIIRNKDIGPGTKLQCAFQLLANFSYPLLLTLILLMLPLAYMWKSLGWHNVILFSLVTITAGTLSVLDFYITAIKKTTGRKWTYYMKYIPFSIALGSGIVINNTKAVIEALLHRNTEFRRTPKFAVVNNKLSNKPVVNYKSSYEIVFTLELLLGSLLLIKTLYAYYAGHYGWIPFLIIIQFGFFYTSILSVLHRLYYFKPAIHFNMQMFYRLIYKYNPKSLK